MKVDVPKEYLSYLNLLVSAGYGVNETSVVKRLIEDGLESTIMDISMGSTEPDMSSSLLDYLKNARIITFEIPNSIKNLDKVEPISEIWGFSSEYTKSIIFCTGLCTDGYLKLQSCSQYKNDSEFRAIMDGIPHELAFEPKEKICKDNELDE